MTNGFMRLHFHREDKLELEAAPPRITAPLEDPKSPFFGTEEVMFESDEAAARFYLDQELGLDSRAAMQAIRSPDEPELVPGLEMRRAEEQPLTGTHLVQFEQTVASIPIFGSHALVELTPDRDLVSIDAHIADLSALEQVSPMPTLGAAEALSVIGELAGVEQGSLSKVKPPRLMLYQDEEQHAWHLVYYFTNVPAAPAEFLEDALEAGGHGLDSSPRQRQPELDYLLDAHSGEVLLYYSSHPMLAALAVPVKLQGLDVEGQQRDFSGSQGGSGFQLSDPLRNIKTYDLQYQPIDQTPVPSAPVSHVAGDWANANPAAISAHVNATLVYDFYKSVLQRVGVDNKGMELVSIVNCVEDPNASPPVWRNAYWWHKRMWYGQDEDPQGNLRSMARHLDIIAHELTHGVTEHTAGLKYFRKSGALNESFSDIFGVIIKNWVRHGPNSDVSLWDWEIGPGFRGSGLPLRDLSDPKRTGHPDHMDDFLNTWADNGGVHTNSNIHNKAAYNVLTAVDEEGSRVFASGEVALLYYLALNRLPMLATFSMVLGALLDVAKTYFSGFPGVREVKLAALRQAYAEVGIESGA